MPRYFFKRFSTLVSSLKKFVKKQKLKMLTLCTFSHEPPHMLLAWFPILPVLDPMNYRKTPQISTPPKISTPSVFTEICCWLQCPESTYPPNVSTPESWKYVHNRWNMHNSVLCAKSTGLNRLLPCRIFASALSYPPKISTCSVANPENTYVLINGVLQ